MAGLFSKTTQNCEIKNIFKPHQTAKESKNSLSEYKLEFNNINSNQIELQKKIKNRNPLPTPAYIRKFNLYKSSSDCVILG